jgi:hypothetical protein
MGLELSMVLKKKNTPGGGRSQPTGNGPGAKHGHGNQRSTPRRRDTIRHLSWSFFPPKVSPFAGISAQRLVVETWTGISPDCLIITNHSKGKHQCFVLLFYYSYNSPTNSSLLVVATGISPGCSIITNYSKRVVQRYSCFPTVSLNTTVLRIIMVMTQHSRKSWVPLF